MGFLFPKAPAAPTPPNPATPAPKTNSFADPRPNAGSFVGTTAMFKTKSQKNSLIGGG